MRSASRKSQAALVALLVLAWSEHAGAGQTLYFPHRDERYLRSRQKNGGAAFVPAGVSADVLVPAVVFLHGTNARGRPHPWFGARGPDLRPLVESLVARGEVAPFVLAGPSQTKSAVFGRTLWQDFSLARFTADLELALAGRATIDPSRLILVGYSGAGCNPSGGLAGEDRSDGGLRPLALVAIDPCLNEEMGSAFALRAPHVPLLMFWQTNAWPRDVDGWLGAMSERPIAPVIARLDAPLPNPHRSIVPMAIELVVRTLVGPPASREDGAPPQSREDSVKPVS